LFKKESWPALVEMIVAHHKSVSGDSSDRGLLDIVNRHGPKRLINCHLKDWEIWSPRGLDILAQLDIKINELTYEQAEKALLWAINYCEELEDDWSKWKGLLMASDHMA